MNDWNVNERTLAIISSWGRMTDTSEAVDGDDAGPALAVVLDALEDDRCREILTALGRPTSANELSDACEIPRSTVYRKIDLLSEAGLVREYTEVRDDGPDATLYERNFAGITITIDESDEFTLSIERSGKCPDERMATFWTEMKRES